jgi:predicted transcriptional regulator
LGCAPAFPLTLQVARKPGSHCNTWKYAVFFCIMSAPRIISFRIAPDWVAELDSIAAALDRDRSYLLNEAVESYLDQQRRFVAMVNEGLRASRHGQTIDDEDLGDLIGSWVKANPAKKQRKARTRS